MGEAFSDSGKTGSSRLAHLERRAVVIAVGQLLSHFPGAVVEAVGAVSSLMPMRDVSNVNTICC
jgi:hypothetical protein